LGSSAWPCAIHGTRAPVRNGVGSAGTRADHIIQSEGGVVRRSPEPKPRTPGVRDESDYSEKIKAGMRRRHGAK